MLGNKKNLTKLIAMQGKWKDDPSKSIIMLYGKEDGGTTTLAASIIDLISPEKKVYVLLTEPPHNFSGPVAKHFPEEHADGRFVVPTMEYNGEIIPKPLMSRSDFIMWKKGVMNRKDMGAVIVDALDSLRSLLFGHYLAKSPSKGTINYADADQDIINEFFIPFSTLQIPIIIILKHKEKTNWDTAADGSLVVEKIKDNKGNAVIVPTMDGEKILRWSTMRLWCTEIGKYTIMKTKGMVDVGEQFRFGFQSGSMTKRTGVWLKSLLERMRGGKDKLNLVKTPAKSKVPSKVEAKK